MLGQCRHRPNGNPLFILDLLTQHHLATSVDDIAQSSAAPKTVKKAEMSSCFGYRKKPKSSEEHNPLLPQYNDDAALQRRVHQKLHTYQMIRALSKGFMPSTEQVISNLRSLLASDLFKAETTVLSDSGCLLLRYSKQWLSESIELLRNKNNGDQIQDFIWSLSHARLSIDANNIVRTASSTRAKADASAGKIPESSFNHLAKVQYSI